MIDDSILSGERPHAQILCIIDWRAELPPGSKVVSVIPSGKSFWVETVRIEVLCSDGSTKLYFMKVRSP